MAGLLRPRSSGFTLIELVMSIVIIGIVGMISMRIISQSVTGWIDTSEREGLASPGAAAAEQLSRAVRRALPNSVRQFDSPDYGRCMEMIPVMTGSQYLSAPVMSSGDELVVFEFPDADVGEQARVVIYPHSAAALYVTQEVISVSAATVGESVNRRQTLQFAADERFLTHSPQRHLYLIENPVAYCDDGAGRLWRYSGYGIHADSSTQLGAGSRSLVLDQLVAGVTRFEVANLGLQRSAIVQIRFAVARADGSEPQTFIREAQLKNVP